MTADQLAILAFEAALDQNAWLWAKLSRAEQEARVLAATRSPGE